MSIKKLISCLFIFQGKISVKKATILESTQSVIDRIYFWINNNV